MPDALAAAAMALPVIDRAVENLTAHAAAPNADGDARSILVSAGAAAVAGAYAVGRSWVKARALQAAAAHLEPASAAQLEAARTAGAMEGADATAAAAQNRAAAAGVRPLTGSVNNGRSQL